MADTIEHGAVVAQATGMVSVQAECTVAEASALLASRAQLFAQPLDVLARAVVDQRIRFGPYTRIARP